MKNILVLCLLVGVLVDTAAAQGRERPRSECLKACNEVGKFRGTERIDRKLAEVRANKATETDPGKLKQLAEEELELIEERADKLQEVCHAICDDNPPG